MFFKSSTIFLLHLELKPKNGFKLKTGFDFRRSVFGSVNLLTTALFMTGPRSRHQRRCVRDTTDFYECMIHSRIESPSVWVPTNLESTLDRETLSPLSLSQGMHMKVFSKVYCDRVYLLCAAERFETGSGFHFYPPLQRHPLPSWEASPPQNIPFFYPLYEITLCLKTSLKFVNNILDPIKHTHTILPV